MEVLTAASDGVVPPMIPSEYESFIQKQVNYVSPAG
jgi:hypothetical protein